MFENFDFSLLDDPEFKEDAVREEIVAPILNRLGYTASGPNRIIRSRSLTHPFVSIGTQQRKINIIPDYLICIESNNAFILDAKAPTQILQNSKHVEQAYSYAIHPPTLGFQFIHSAMAAKSSSTISANWNRVMYAK